jgi:ADP-heptose:LPS heptosyltransferase
VFYGELSLLELASAIHHQDVLTVSNTGPMHLAGLVNTPLVALFSAHPSQAPEKWKPFGTRQRILMPPLRPGESGWIPRHRAEEQMRRISVAHVVEANLASVDPARHAA